MRRLGAWIGAGLAVVSLSCGERDRPWLVEITSEVGLDGPAAWPDGRHALPEIMGPGVALLDADSDGDLDLLQLRMPPPDAPTDPSPNRLWIRGDDGRYTVAVASGLEDPGFAQGVAVGDVNRDGRSDVFFANYGPDALYLGSGGGTFLPAGPEWNVGGAGWSSSAAFCDYDADGDLDLFVTRYLAFDPGTRCIDAAGRAEYCDPDTFPGVPDVLFRNEGGVGFRDVTVEAGLVLSDDGRDAKGLGVVCADLDSDGDLDFYVANDETPNHLWVNRGDGTFDELAMIRGAAVNRDGSPESSMGLAVGDLDGDGHWDLFMTHLVGQNNTFYRGGPRGTFLDTTPDAGTAAADFGRTGFGCALADLDHDGRQDLVVANGAVRRGPVDPAARLGEFWNRYAERNLLFRNLGDGRFDRADDRGGDFTAHVEISRGLAVGDLDGDGDLDLVSSHHDNTVRVYRNDAARPDAHWLVVRPSEAGAPSLGAEVRLEVDGGTLRRLVLASFSYQSSSDPVAHFGLPAGAAVERLEVVWPDGARERFVVPGLDRTLTPERGRGEER